MTKLEEAELGRYGRPRYVMRLGWYLVINTDQVDLRRKMSCREE